MDWRRRSYGTSVVAGAPPLQQVDRQQHHERRGQHHRGDRRGAGVVVLLELGDDQQRRDFGPHRHVAGDEHHRAVFAEGPGERQREAGQQRRQHGRQDHSPERLPARRAQAGGRFFGFAVDFLDRRLQRANHERQADEHQRDDDSQRRERHLDAQRLQVLADPAVLRVHGRQRDARHGRRQRERQVDHRVDELLAGNRVANQRPGDDEAEERVDHRGDERRAERQLVRGDDARRPGAGPEAVPAQAARF